MVLTERGAACAAKWCACKVSWSSAETCWKPRYDTWRYLHSLVQDVRPPGLTANNPQGPVPGKMGHSIFRKKLPNSAFFLASYVNCINRLLQIQGHTFWAIIFLHKIYEILKEDYKWSFMLVSFFEVRIHIFIITLPQTSEELFIILLVLFPPEAPKLSHNYFFKKPFQMQHWRLSFKATTFHFLGPMLNFHFIPVCFSAQYSFSLYLLSLRSLSGPWRWPK